MSEDHKLLAKQNLTNRGSFDSARREEHDGAIATRFCRADREILTKTVDHMLPQHLAGQISYDRPSRLLWCEHVTCSTQREEHNGVIKSKFCLADREISAVKGQPAEAAAVKHEADGGPFDPSAAAPGLETGRVPAHHGAATTSMGV